MEINEILNRFEVLFPSESKFADLRRSVIDRDLYSIFRLVQNEDLRKVVLEDNQWALWRLLEQFTASQFVPALKYLQTNNIEFDTDCLSQGQLKSKLWLIEEVKKLDIDLGTVFLCAGWYGTLSAMMFEHNIKLTKVRSFDIDPECTGIAEVFNKPWVMDNWKFKPSIKDILEINYEEDTYTVKRTDGTEHELTDKPDTIINTSCEHIENFSAWWDKIPKGKLVIVQSNNYFSHYDSGHVNCSISLEDFAESTPMQLCLYEGELALPKYTRFMRIGYR